MKSILIDSSFYIALIYAQDSNHNKAIQLVDTLTPGRYQQATTEDFLKETLTTISQRAGKQASVDFYQSLMTNTEIIPITSEYFQNGLNLFLKPAINKNISLIDCIAVEVYKNIHAKAILTFDTHFRTLKAKILPA